MDVRKLLSKTEDSIKINERDFLHWILNIVDISDRYGLCFVKLYVFAVHALRIVIETCEERKMCFPVKPQMLS